MIFGSRFNAAAVASCSALLLLGSASAQDDLEKLHSALEEVRLIHDQPTPTPTTDPLLVRGDSEGRKRQLFGSSTTQTGLGTTTFTITQAPDNTCGFLSGSVGVPITCANNKKCAWEAEYINAIYCGGLGSEAPALRCIERDIATNTASCNDVCQLNKYNLLCTNATAPFCGTYSFPNGVRAYRCATATQLSASVVAFRYSGEIECQRPYETTVLGDDITTTYNTCAGPTRSRSSSNTLPSVTSSSSVAVSPSSSDPPVAAGGGSDGGGSSSNIGAIVGGVVGGVAVLGLIGLGVFFLIRRSKKQPVDGNNNPQQLQQPPPGPYPADPKYYGGNPGSPGPPQQMGEVFHATGPSPTNYYDPAFKGHQGSVGYDPSTSPHTTISQTFSPHPSQAQHYPTLSTATSQDFNSINRASYSSAGAPPMYQPQPGVPPQQFGNQPMSAIHEIDSGNDHHRGRLHEVQ